MLDCLRSHSASVRFRIDPDTGVTHILARSERGGRVCHPETNQEMVEVLATLLHSVNALLPERSDTQTSQQKLFGRNALKRKTLELQDQQAIEKALKAYAPTGGDPDPGSNATPFGAQVRVTCLLPGRTRKDILSETEYGRFLSRQQIWDDCHGKVNLAVVRDGAPETYTKRIAGQYMQVCMNLLARAQTLRKDLLEEKKNRLLDQKEDFTFRSLPVPDSKRSFTYQALQVSTHWPEDLLYEALALCIQRHKIRPLAEIQKFWR